MPETKEAPKKVSLVDKLESVVEGFEKQDKPFDHEDEQAAKALVKRLSRTLGEYREP